MTNRLVLKEMEIDLDTQKWNVSPLADQSLIGPVQYGWNRYKLDNDSMTLGGGLLAGSPLPGTRRMIFCGYSPQWEGFYVSALGGAMYVMHRLGVHFVWLHGKCQTTSVLVLNYVKGKYSVTFDAIAPGQYWAGYQDKTGRVWDGFYGLQRHLFEKYQSFYDGDSWRILTLGPAANNTVSGAIGSNHIKQGDLTNIEDWAGRGGLGSRLLQHHGIAGIVFGGDWQDPALKEAKELDHYFIEHFGQKTIQVDLALSEKYRYVPKFDTGGTFGVNMYEGEDRIFSFNYSSIYQTAEARLAQHTNFITDHYLKQFNEEIIVPRKFSHCGEPCAVACKKYVGEFKKDYEPYEALGPNIGVFDQRAAEKVNKYVDVQGMDSIQAGGTVAWLMEIFYKGILDPKRFGISGLPKFDFVSKTIEFDLERDSDFNAEYAIKILNMILNEPIGEPFRKGIRFAAKWIDQKYHLKTVDSAVYTANGENGCMVPNQYWVPGMYAPMPIMGKYFSYYGNEFIPPKQLGKKNIERFVYELYSENSGSCRFHRKWVEDIIDEIILSHFTLDLEYWKTNFTLVKEIVDFQSRSAVFWESERIVDIIHEFLKRWQEHGLKDIQLEEWVTRFDSDKWNAAKAFWDDMYSGMLEAVEQMFDEPIHVEHAAIKR